MSHNDKLANTSTSPQPDHHHHDHDHGGEEGEQHDHHHHDDREHDHHHDDHDHGGEEGEHHDHHHHDDHEHGDDHHHDDDHGDAQPRERKKKGPSENPENLSEQLVSGSLRGRRSKCSHGCGSDGGCSTGGCGVSSLVEMIANKFDYTDRREIVEVTFAGYRRGFTYLEDENMGLRVRDVVVVRSANGLDWGVVSMTGSLVHAKRKAKRLSNEEMPLLLRKADENDLKRVEQCKVSERHAFSVCRTRVESFNLPMVLVGAEWQFDHKKLTFFFTADGRVDFRELVRDLAAIFNTRIELRQIPVRDAAKRIGGMGVCGLELCCTTHLGRYEHITLDHAKIQQIPANPSKLSGQCGRLKCCLLYEIDTYVEGLKRFPPLESTIQTDIGLGTIHKIDLFRDLIYLHHAATSEWETLTLEDYRDIIAGKRKKKEPEPMPEVKSVEKKKTDIAKPVENRKNDGNREEKGAKREGGRDGRRDGSASAGERKQGGRPTQGNVKREGGKPVRSGGGAPERRRADKEASVKAAPAKGTTTHGLSPKDPNPNAPRAEMKVEGNSAAISAGEASRKRRKKKRRGNSAGSGNKSSENQGGAKAGNE